MYCKVIVVVLDKDSVLNRSSTDDVYDVICSTTTRQQLKKIDNASNNGISIADDNDVDIRCNCKDDDRYTMQLQR